MPRTMVERVSPSPQAIRFQKLKTDIHRQLIEGLDMSTLNRIKPERLRREVEGGAGASHRRGGHDHADADQVLADAARGGLRGAARG